MPGIVAPVANEREGLVTFLAHQRYVLRLTAHGLTDDQARQATTAGPLTVGGIVKHCAAVERTWMDAVLQRGRSGSSEDYEANFRMGGGDTLVGLLDDYAVAAAETDAIVASIDDLGHPVPVPRGVPWYPGDVDAWSLRWVLLHLIQETARHAGHADIVREGIDGATAFPLMAGAEGWPATPWIKPWQPNST
jgi:uncharacterized damage-inducible protein DinB